MRPSERAAGRNIESKADAAVAQGWQVYMLTGGRPSPASRLAPTWLSDRWQGSDTPAPRRFGGPDYEDVSDLLHSTLPDMLCYRR